MSTHYLYYTKPGQAAVDMDIHGVDGIGLDHWASDQFKKVQPGDHLWIVTIEEGELFLIGHLPVEHLMTHEEAVKFLGRDDLYARNHHVVCSPDRAEYMTVVNIHSIAPSLRFHSDKDRLAFCEDGTVTAHQIQSMRRLTEDSTEILEAWWYEEDGLEEVDAGYRLDPDLRRQVEQAAVDHVTACLVDEGWEVESVETDRCGYDLRCTRGKVERHVEVKGTASEHPGFIITSQELACSVGDPSFELWIVTNALTDHPTVRSYLGNELERHFAFDAIQYRATPIVSGS